MRVASIYLPNGNPQPGPKFDDKLKWMARLHRHARTLVDLLVEQIEFADVVVLNKVGTATPEQLDAIIDALDALLSEDDAEADEVEG